MTEMLRADGRSGTGMTEMLQGLMQDDFPLTLNHIRRRMRTCNLGAEVVTLNEDGSVRRDRATASCPTASTASRARSRPSASSRATGSGRSRGTTSATSSCTSRSPCTGAVLHTLNIRLFEEQLTYIVNHAEDRVIFVDDSLVPVLEKLAPELAGVEHYVVMGDGPTAGELPNALALRGAARAARAQERSTTPSSTSARRRRSATRAARRATRRACSTRTARSACTPPPP